MGEESLDPLLAQIARQGNEFAKLATTVSDRLESIEESLRCAGGKLPITFLGDNIALSFDRTANGWGLWVIDPCEVRSIEEINLYLDEAWMLLRESPVVVKARALRCLPKMLLELARLQQVQLSELVSAVGDLPAETEKKKGGRGNALPK